MSRRSERLDAATAVAEALDTWYKGWSAMPDDFSDVITALERWRAVKLAHPDTPLAPFAQSSDTSQTAARMIAPRAGSIRREILAEIYWTTQSARVPQKPGLSDQDLERRLKRPHTTVSSARNWLREEGWLTDSGHRTMTASGRPAVLWKLTAAAIHSIHSGLLTDNKEESG